MADLENFRLIILTLRINGKAIPFLENYQLSVPVALRSLCDG